MIQPASENVFFLIFSDIMHFSGMNIDYGSVAYTGKLANRDPCTLLPYLIPMRQEVVHGIGLWHVG